MPASSPLCSLIISYLNFFLSNHFMYILLSISAQSWLSVPPAPACISIKQSLLSLSLDKKHLISFFWASDLNSSVFFVISWRSLALFSSEAKIKNSFNSLHSLTEFSNDNTRSSNFFFSFKIFWALDWSFQKFSSKINFWYLSILDLILFFSKILLYSLIYFFNRV